MRKSLSNKLEVFLHQNIQRILQVSMTRVREEGIQNKHMWRTFYNIPCFGSIIAARQFDFIGKTVCGPSDRPAQQMLTTSCNTVCQIGHPFLHNKDYIVKNLHLLFASVPEVTINKYSSLKHWIKEASHEQYWKQLVTCLTDRHATTPVCPDEWP
jgi:hypothetical protein